LPQPHELSGEVEETLVLNDWTAYRTTELVTHQRILDAVAVGEEAVGGQRLNAVVFKSRSVPLVGAALEHGVGHESARQSVFGTEVMLNHAELFDRIRRNGGVGSAGGSTGIHAEPATQTLVVVVKPLHQVVPGAAAGSVYRRATVGTAIEIAKGDVALG